MSTEEQSRSSDRHPAQDPFEIIVRRDLSDDQKLEILRQLEEDARQLEVAQDEGMEGEGESMLARVLEARRRMRAA